LNDYFLHFWFMITDTAYFLLSDCWKTRPIHFQVILDNILKAICLQYLCAEHICLRKILLIKFLLFSFVTFILRLVFAALALILSPFIVLKIKLLICKDGPHEGWPWLVAAIVLRGLEQLIRHLLYLRSDTINNIHVAALPERIGNILAAIFVNSIRLICILRTIVKWLLLVCRVLLLLRLRRLLHFD
jgi:hypothetical protein